MSRDIRLYLEDIDESIKAINDYVKDMDFDDFISDRKTYSATIREFEIIGEAVGCIMDYVKQDNSVEWQDIKDFRNLLIHEYFGVDFEIVWDVIVDDLPKLQKSIKSFLKE
jgi:uncharacterized protein with HEPN domain